MAKVSAIFKTESQLSTTGTTLVSTTVAGEVKTVSTASFFNTSTSDAQTVKVYRHLTANAIADTNLVEEKAIPPRKAWNCIIAQGKVIPENYSLTATATTESTVNAECEGVSST